MGLFGGSSEEKQRDNDALAAEVMRLDALPYEALAREVLTKGFGHGGPGADWPVAFYEIKNALNPTDRIFGMDDALLADFDTLVHEGLHMLYRAGLAQWVFSGGDTSSMRWSLTRAGRRALEQGTVDVALQGCGPKVP